MNDEAPAIDYAAIMLAAHLERMKGYSPVVLPATPCDRSRNRQRTTPRRTKRRPI